MIRFHISSDAQHLTPEITYLLQIWAKNQQQEIVFSDSPDGSVTLGKGDKNVFVIPEAFAQTRIPGIAASGMVEDERGRPDPLTTAFYLMNSLQEFDDTDADELGRFKFTNSHQYKLNNNLDNVVQRCFDEISKTLQLPPRRENSRFFLSHDIDLIHGAILEDGFNVIRKGRVDLLLQMIFRVAIRRPDWLNMDKIMKLESEYDCRSIFFWLVNRGKLNARERNADYNFSSAKVQKQFRLVKANGFENGLHKSISPDTFAEEISKLGEHPTSNRYHYLKFHLPQAYHDIEAAGLKLDASLGFAEAIGFRNNYGAPFNPFNFNTRKPFSFVEVPLHIMDRTFFQYRRSSPEEAWKAILAFFERNKENAVLSVLWHNNFFTNYKFKGYPELYRKILAYIRDNQFQCISAEEIIRKYSIIK